MKKLMDSKKLVGPREEADKMMQLIERNDRGGYGTVPRPVWDSNDPRALSKAVSDACYIYRYRDLEHNLRRFGWRQARKRILQRGTLSGEWVSRDRRGELRLRRRGLEVRFDNSKRIIGWKELQEFIWARRY
jgi:hypothetical protein